jgi:hypothetical protein
MMSAMAKPSTLLGRLPGLKRAVLIYRNVAQQPAEQLRLQEHEKILDDFETTSECKWATVCDKEGLPE